MIFLQTQSSGALQRGLGFAQEPGEVNAIFKQSFMGELITESWECSQFESYLIPHGELWVLTFLPSF